MCYLCRAFTVCKRFAQILWKVPTKFMLDIAGNELSMQANMMAYMLRTQLLVQFIQWLQKYQQRHSHSNRRTYLYNTFSEH